MLRALFAVAMVLAAHLAPAEVLVSGDVPVVIDNQALVNAGSWATVEIGRFTPGRAVKATLNFNGGTGDLSAAILDEANLNFYRQGLPFRAHHVVRQPAPISLEGTTWSYGPYFLLLDNRHAVLAGRQVTYRVEYMDKIDPAAQKELKEKIEQLYSALKDTFVFPDFNIHVAPCG